MSAVSASVDRWLPKSERERIRQAVAETEAETSAEIVVCVVSESDDYAESRWRAGVWFGLLGAFLALLWSLVRLRSDPFRFDVYSFSFAVPIVVGAVIGILLVARVPWIRRQFLSEARRQRRVRQHAERSFVVEEVFATEGRTGVLLFVSLFERIVSIVPDVAVGGAVDESEWHAITERMARGIGSGALGDSLCAGVAECGQLLAAKGLTRRPDDQNELDDRVRFE